MNYLYLFGYPLGHSVSPAMQNAALRACGVRGTRYEPRAFPPERLSDMFAVMREPNALGANVTVPYKQMILPHLDGLTELAREIGAVNTIVKRDGQLVGDNTDAYGFIRSLRVRRIEPRGKRAAILGAGGAAAAVAFALGDAGAREILLLNRTPARSAALAERLEARFPKLQLVLDDWGRLGRAALVVNATSVGMTPRMDGSPLPPDGWVARGVVVYDLVYNPPLTLFLREARARGARVIGGLEMLVYQGARALELWTGARAPVRVMRAAAQAALDSPS